VFLVQWGVLCRFAVRRATSFLPDFFKQNNLSSQRYTNHINLITQPARQNSEIRLKHVGGIGCY